MNLCQFGSGPQRIIIDAGDAFGQCSGSVSFLGNLTEQFLENDF